MMNFPDPSASPWTDPNDQIWTHDGDGWIETAPEEEEIFIPEIFTGPGSSGYVPDPITANGNFLMDDGTWGVEPGSDIYPKYLEVGSHTMSPSANVNDSIVFTITGRNFDVILAYKEVKGARVEVSGRLDGKEIARREWLKKGRLPRQTIRADIDYGTARARCSYGTVGVKVWVYKGDKF